MAWRQDSASRRGFCEAVEFPARNCSAVNQRRNAVSEFAMRHGGRSVGRTCVTAKATPTRPMAITPRGRLQRPSGCGSQIPSSGSTWARTFGSCIEIKRVPPREELRPMHMPSAPPRRLCHEAATRSPYLLRIRGGLRETIAGSSVPRVLPQIPVQGCGFISIS